MKYFNKFYKHIFFIKRDYFKEMSSFKLFLWENHVFVNCIIPPGENESKFMMSMILPFKSKKLNLCRDPNDTVQVFTDRLSLKISQLCEKKKKKKIATSINTDTSNILLKVDGNTVPADSIIGNIFKENNLNITLQIMDNVYKVLVNAPMINDLKLYVPPYKGLMMYPYAFDKGYNVSIMNSKYSWYRIDNLKNVIEVGNDFAYTPTTNDVNCCLKLICSPYNENGLSGPPAEIISSTVEDNNTDIYPHEKRLKMKPNNSIRVVTYNLLAGEYTKTKEAKNDMYPYCPENILASSYRYPLIMRELLAYKADICCLQEVESSFFNRELSPLLKHYMGMDGIFLKKNSRRSEGLACFYSHNKFTLLDQFDIKVNYEALESYCGHIIENIVIDEIWKQGLEKKTVFQVLLLELIADKKKLFLICNTHLISDPEGDSIRLFQSLVELTIVNQIKKTVNDNYPECDVSVIFCGDFNSTPESGVYDLFTKLVLPEEYSDVKILNLFKNILKFNLHSSYDTNTTSYSNYTNTFSGLLDYIYFTNQHLELVQVLSMPLHTDVIQHGGLPSILFPSDHIALIADLELK